MKKDEITKQIHRKKRVRIQLRKHRKDLKKQRKEEKIGKKTEKQQRFLGEAWGR